MKKMRNRKRFVGFSYCFKRLSFTVCIVGMLSFMNMEVYGQKRRNESLLK